MFYSRSSQVLFLIASLLCSIAAQALGDEPETKYVQAAQVELKVEPNQSGKSVATLKRGAMLTITETKGHWVKVTAGSLTGWTSKVFLSTHRPVGQADLAKEVPTTLEKASRRRPQSYTVNAAARGLSEDENLRQGSDGYKTDYKALKRIEERNIPATELNQFKDSAKLPK